MRNARYLSVEGSCILDPIFDFLAVEQNRDVLTFFGGGIAAVAGGAWIVIRYVLERKKGTPAPPPSTTIQVKDSTGVHINNGTGVGFERSKIYALVFFAVGFLIFVVGLSGGGISASNGSIAAGGDVTGNIVIEND